MNRSISWTVGLFSSILFIITACISKTPSNKEPLDVEALTKNQPEEHGKIVTPEDVHLTNPLNRQWVTEGKNIYDVKCQPCHNLTDEKLVGPGFKGVTDRRTPEWIMNFVTNTEEMLAKDTAAQTMLEVCLVKMPNQGLSETDARSVLEFMRKNDGKQ